MAVKKAPAGDPAYLDALIDSAEEKRGGREQAFKHFYNDHSQRVKEAVGKALRGSCDTGLLEDLTHDIILKIYFALQRGRYQPGGNFNGFVWCVATNTTYNYLRDNARRQRILQERIAHEPVASVTLEGVFQQADKGVLLTLISQLSKNHREILHLRFFDGLIYAEIAEKLGVPMGTTMSRLSRAKDALRALLEKDRDLVDELVA